MYIIHITFVNKSYRSYKVICNRTIINYYIENSYKLDNDINTNIFRIFVINIIFLNYIFLNRKNQFIMVELNI